MGTLPVEMAAESATKPNFREFDACGPSLPRFPRCHLPRRRYNPVRALAVIRAQGEEAAAFVAVYTEAVRRLEALHGPDHVRWYDLMRIVLTWAAWKRPAPERATLLTAVQAGPADPAHQKELQTMSQTIAEALIAEGVAKGEARGEAKGALQASRKLLRGLLENRFGALSEAVRQRIDGATDLDRLEAAVLQVLRLGSLDELQL